jgi:hypothetical protein
MQDRLFISDEESLRNEVLYLRSAVDLLEQDNRQLRSDIDERVLAAVDVLQRQFDGRMRSLASELENLSILMPRPKPKPEKLQVVMVFPPMETLVQIKGQLFYNPPNTSGQHGGARQHEHVMKLSFWSCDNDDAAIMKHKNGNVEPFYFPLHTPSDAKWNSPDSLLARSVRDLGAALIGGREIKGAGKARGTARFEQRVAAIMPVDDDGEQMLIIDDDDWQDSLQFQINDCVKPAPGDDPKVPVAIWTWRRPITRTGTR